MENTYDIIIIGGGPAGYTAGIYGARAGFNTLILEKLSPGGQMATTESIENYPGFEDEVDGFDLGEAMKKGADKAGAKTKLAEVYGVELSDKIKKVATSDGDFFGKTVIIATGADPRTTGVDGEEELVNRGVCYCATCDGMAYRGKNVAVLGGGNSAVEEATYLSNICSKVYLIHRRNEFRAMKSVVDRALAKENIEPILNVTLQKFEKDDVLTGVVLKDKDTDELKNLEIDGFFVSIGRVPNTKIFEGKVDMDESGYIIADESTKTNVAGVFVAGDVRTKEVRQIVTATADGACAVKGAENYIAENF